jgi:NADH:ubiquinone oxidoreductase subunit E
MNPAELREHLQPVVANYPHTQAALAPLLHVLLAAKRPIDNDAMAIVAELCDVDVRSIAELVTYYPAFQKGQVASQTEVCFGLPCSINGAREVFEEMRSSAPNGNGVRKPVSMSACLGHCYAAPVVKCDDGSLCRASFSKANHQAEATNE